MKLETGAQLNKQKLEYEHRVKELETKVLSLF